MSETANTRAQIDAANDAAWQGLHGLAMFANHASITARMEQMCIRIQALYDQDKSEEAQSLLTNDNLWNM